MVKKILGTKRTKLGTVIRIECDRCNGTGNWGTSSYRVCYKCGGRGEICEDSAEASYNRKLAHVNEVKEIIAMAERLLTTSRLGRNQIQKTIDMRKAQLVELEAELALMKKE